MIKILICGLGGKMGGNLYELLKDDKAAEIICGVDLKAPENCNVPVYPSFSDVRERADVIIDFSSPAVLTSELDYAMKQGVPLVLASTGYTKEQLEEIDRASQKIAVFRSANFSLGVNLLVDLVRKAAQVLGEAFDVEIVEKHHAQKVDAPSGTALMLADSVNAAFGGEKSYLNGREGMVGKRGGEIGLHAVRGGTIVGEHDVLFCGEDEIITISHSARSKKVFAAGAVKAAKWIVGKPAGKYDMKNVLDLG